MSYYLHFSEFQNQGGLLFMASPQDISNAFVKISTLVNPITPSNSWFAESILYVELTHPLVGQLDRMEDFLK